MNPTTRPDHFGRTIIATLLNIVTVFFSIGIQIFAIVKFIQFIFYTNPSLLTYVFPAILLLAGVRLEGICYKIEVNYLRDRRKEIIDYYNSVDDDSDKNNKDGK